MKGVEMKYWNVLMDALILGCVFLATVYSIEWAQNIVYFVSGIVGFGCLTLLCSGEWQSELAQSDRAPQWISHLTDASSMLLLAAFGWWWCAVAFLLSINAVNAIWKKKSAAAQQPVTSSSSSENT